MFPVMVILGCSSLPLLSTYAVLQPVKLYGFIKWYLFNHLYIYYHRLPTYLLPISVELSHRFRIGSTLVTRTRLLRVIYGNLEKYVVSLRPDWYHIIEPFLGARPGNFVAVCLFIQPSSVILPMWSLQYLPINLTTFVISSPFYIILLLNQSLRVTLFKDLSVLNTTIRGHPFCCENIFNINKNKYLQIL